MEAGVKSKIPYLLCFICFFLVQSVSLQGENEAVKSVHKAVGSLIEDSTKNTVRRSADWSKRIQQPRNVDYSSHVAEESENVEVTSKIPRIVRKLRIQNGRSQNMEAFKDFTPESRSSEGGTKIVRIKKFKRKPQRMTTIVPDTTSRHFSPTPPTTDSMLTSSSPYSHITVINKEIRNPKKRKNKRKRPNNRYASTPSYDSESRLNGLKYATEFPDVHHMSHQNRQDFNNPNSQPSYGSFYDQREHPVQKIRENKFLPQEHLRSNPDSLSMNENNYRFKPEQPRMSQHLSSFKDVGQSDYQERNSMIIPKQSAPKPSFGIYNDLQRLKVAESTNENLKNISSELEKNKSNSDKTNTENISVNSDKTNAEVTIQRAGDSSTTVLPSSVKKSPNSKVNEEKLNTSVTRTPEAEPVLYPETRAVPEQDRNYKQEYRFPSQYPSLFYNRKNAFNDPFFDTPDMPSLMQRPGTNQQVISPLNLPFSPFYASNIPQKEDSFFDRSIIPYQSEDLILPGFHHSPELRSLRRSIVDAYGEDTTTSEPVTPFSLPKFEMPDIDFNDKGCQTVYKEVKTVPSRGSESRSNKEKSFVVTRECFFPNGLPSSKKTKEVESTTIPSSTKISKEKLDKN